MREEDDDLGAGGSKRCRLLARHGDDVRVERDGPVLAHRVVGDGEPEDADLHAAHGLEDRGEHERRELPEVPGVRREERNRARGESLREDSGEVLGTRVELVVADGHRVEAHRRHPLQLGHAQVEVEEEVSLEDVPGVEEKSLRVLRPRRGDHRRDLGDSSDRPFEASVAGTGGVEVGVRVGDVEDRDGAVGGQERRGEKEADGQGEGQEGEAFHRSSPFGASARRTGSRRRTSSLRGSG